MLRGSEGLQPVVPTHLGGHPPLLSPHCMASAGAHRTITALPALSTHRSSCPHVDEHVPTGLTPPDSYAKFNKCSRGIIPGRGGGAQSHRECSGRGIWSLPLFSRKSDISDIAFEAPHGRLLPLLACCT